MNWKQNLSRLYKTYIDPIFYKSRLQARLATYGLDVHSEIPVANLNCALECACQGPLCHHLFVTYGGYFDQFFYSPANPLTPLYSKLTLHAIDLIQYPSFNEYRADLGKRSSFFLRQAKRAGKKGYVVREFNPADFSGDIADISASMRFRSFGPMWPAFSKQSVRDEEALKKLPSQDTSCSVHWDRYIGVFTHGPNAIQGDVAGLSQLVGYARLQRIGNVVAYEDLIGHCDFMNDGIMKLLHCHILHWLLDSKEDDVNDLEYVVHGSIERGSDGIFFWKKKSLFTPYMVDLSVTDLPADFEEAEYLRLNPDVKAAGLDPISHYRVYGQKEGRRYFLDQDLQEDLGSEFESELALNSESTSEAEVEVPAEVEAESGSASASASESISESAAELNEGKSLLTEIDELSNELSDEKNDELSDKESNELSDEQRNEQDNRNLAQEKPIAKDEFKP